MDSRPAQIGAKKAEAALTKVGVAAKKTESQFDKLQNSLGGFKTLFAGIGIGLAVREFGQLLDSATNIDNRLKLVTKTGDEVNAVFDELSKISRETRTGLESNAALFNRLALSTKELGLTYKEQIDLTRSLNQALVISGASAAEGGAGLIQLSQGLAAGALRGDELRSVMEGLPKVADVIAKQFGVTRGELKTLGEQGKISAKDVVEAFKKAAPELQAQFSQIAPTIASSFTVLNNAALEFTRNLNNATGVSGVFAKTILALADNFNILIAAASGFAIILGGVVLKAVISFGIALAANPIGLLIIAVGALSTAMGIFGDSTSEVAGMTVTGWQQIEAAVITAWGFVKPIFDLWVDAWDRIGKAVGSSSTSFKVDLGGVVDFVKAWFSVVIGIFSAIPKSIALVFEDIPTGIEIVLKGAINKFLDFRKSMLNLIGTIPGSILRIFGQDKAAAALDGQIQEFIDKTDVGRLTISDNAQKTAGELGKIWTEAFRTDRLDEFGSSYVANLKKVVTSDLAAQASADLLNGRLQELNKTQKLSAELIKERDKLTKKIQSSFDKIREATGRAVEVTKEWVDKTRAELNKLGLANTKFAEQFEEIVLEKMQAARIQDVKNTQAWAAGLTMAQREVAESVRDNFAVVRAARGENVAMLDEWLMEEQRVLQAAGLENSIYAQQLEEIYKNRLPDARKADIESATDAVGGIRQAMLAYTETVGTAADQTKNLFNNTFQNMEDGLVNFVKTGKLDFSSLINSMIDDLIRLGIQQAITAAFGGGSSGGGGGIGGIIAGAAISAFSAKDGGLTSNPTSVNKGSAPISAFADVPHFQTGGLTSGATPAILHDNEAVIPLSKNRKVPVEMPKESSGDTIIQNFNITSDDGPSFNRNQDQIATRASRGIDRAKQRNR